MADAGQERNDVSQEAAGPTTGTAAGLFDLVTTGRLTTTVGVKRAGQVIRYHLAEMPASLMATCNRMAHREDLQDGRTVFDTHRFKCLQVIACLDGPSAIPGDTFDAKVAHLIQTDKGPIPAIDVIAQLPSTVFDPLYDGVCKVNLDTTEAQANLETAVVSIGALYSVMEYMVETKKTFADLEDDETYLSEVALFSAFWRLQRKAQAAERERLVETLPSMPELPFGTGR